MTGINHCDSALPLAAPNMTIGLLGGSFDPPHDGHVTISLAAMKKLELDQVWWLVSPANPLKTDQPWSLSRRLQQCRNKASHPGIRVTGFEGQRENFYTVDSLHYLKRRFPRTRFIWIMGADNLEGVHRWYRWHDIFRLMPVLVMDRPGYRFSALSARARYCYSGCRVPDYSLPGLAKAEMPAWGMLALPLDSHSSTDIRGKYSESAGGIGAGPVTGPGCMAWPL